MENKMNYVMWTGGWDSTFMILHLIHKGKGVIQPIYVSGDGRKSEALEIQAMNHLLPQLRAIKDAQIEDLIIVEKKSIPENQKITKAFQRIRSKVRIGTQYEWLARLAEVYKGVALGIEKPSGEYSGCVTAIEKTGKIEKKDGFYFIDINNSTEDCNLLFGNFCFPLYDIDEKTMLELVRKNHEEEIMQNVWFCQNPINELPCGFCRPCQQKMECGMQQLLPNTALKRYNTYKKLTKIFGERLGRKMIRESEKIKHIKNK